MKYLITLIVSTLALQIFAQSKENERFAFGFFTGIETQSLGVQPLDTREPDEAAVRAGRIGFGTSLGAFGRKQWLRGLYFQPAISFAYTENHLNFRKEGAQAVRFWDAEVPLHLVVTNWRKSDFPLRGCVIFGCRMGWNFAYNPANLIRIANERFGLDLGLGAEINLGRWRLQPAFIYSHGLNNLHLVGNATYDDAVGKIVRDKLSLRISAWIPGK